MQRQLQRGAHTAKKSNRTGCRQRTLALLGAKLGMQLLRFDPSWQQAQPSGCRASCNAIRGVDSIPEIEKIDPHR